MIPVPKVPRVADDVTVRIGQGRPMGVNSAGSSGAPAPPTILLSAPKAEKPERAGGLENAPPLKVPEDYIPDTENVTTLEGMRGDEEFSFKQDSNGNTTRARGRIEGPHIGRKKAKPPDPIGGRSAGDHRGHLVPEGSVKTPSKVNVSENIISEAPGSNLGPKKQLIDNKAAQLAAENPNSVIETVHEPLRMSGQTRPYAVNHYILKDGKIVYGVTIMNRNGTSL